MLSLQRTLKMQVHEEDILAVLLIISITVIYCRSLTPYPITTIPTGVLLTVLFNVLFPPKDRQEPLCIAALLSIALETLQHP